MVDLELDELKREFLTEAREKVREIESNLDGGARPDSMERLTYLAHQLKGSGGSYGFERISAEAAQLEKAVEGVSDARVPDGLKTKLREHASNLRAEVDSRLREFSPAMR
jgi:HPt (histidine-containing phosphotransfer) domain-containing protein